TKRVVDRPEGSGYTYPMKNKRESSASTAHRGAWCAVFFSVAVTLALVGSEPQSTRAADTPKPLQIFFVDVEGGQSTLFVTPSGQSLLIDTGWPGNNGRDADRIVAAAKAAGLSKIDFVLLTHYHMDHTGGVPQLAARIPVGTFIDHGDNRETDDPTT